MDKNEIKVKKPRGKGGARPGAGRPKGGTNSVSITSLLAALQEKSGGKHYEDILVDDFLQARNNNDTQLIIKYHNLILNKVMNTLAKIEVTDSSDALQAKQQAFSEALAKLTGINKE